MRSKRAPAVAFDESVRSVVERNLCSGCGFCAALDESLVMAIDDEGFSRPERTGESTAGWAEVETFNRACPGRRVDRPPSDAPHHDPILGSFYSVSEGWSADDDGRFAGSSGGVITALALWIKSNTPDAQIVGAGPNPGDPTRTSSIIARSEADVRSMAGSRYAPASNAQFGAAADLFVGKPCEVSAVRQGSPSSGTPLISFFCAGTPSQQATDRLIQDLGFPVRTDVTALRYRGHGWPGKFVVEGADGTRASVDYQDSWGKALGPAVQWRCKICPDGLGNAGDLAVGDYWQTDDRGYPVFAEGGGRSAVIARTKRGQDILDAAVAANVIVIAPLAAADVVNVQPLQVERLGTLAGRLAGSVLAGGKAPAYRGFGLTRLAARAPIRSSRYAWGSFKRVVQRARR